MTMIEKENKQSANAENTPKKLFERLKDDFDSGEFFSANRKYKIEIVEEWEDRLNPNESTDYFSPFKFLIPRRQRDFNPQGCTEPLEDFVDGRDKDKDFRKLERMFGKGNVFFVSAMIHGSVHLYLGEYTPCRWDSGILGFLILDAEKARDFVKFTKKFKKSDYASSYIREWNHCMNEPEYRFAIYEFDDECRQYDLIDGIGGYRDEDEAIMQALESAQYEFEDGWENA